VRAPSSRVPVASFDRLNYLSVRASLRDGHIWPECFEEWLERARVRSKELCDLGDHPVRVEIDAQKFKLWCLINNRQADTESFGEYVRTRPVDR